MTPVLGGRLRGFAAEPSATGFSADILSGGGDRQLIRPDGTVEIDASYEARTLSDEHIGIRASGIRRLNDDTVYFRVALRFETAAPALAWLQDALFIADGVRETEHVRHTVYRVG